MFGLAQSCGKRLQTAIVESVVVRPRQDVFVWCEVCQSEVLSQENISGTLPQCSRCGTVLREQSPTDRKPSNSDAVQNAKSILQKWSSDRMFDQISAFTALPPEEKAPQKPEPSTDEPAQPPVAEHEQLPENTSESDQTDQQAALQKETEPSPTEEIVSEAKTDPEVSVASVTERNLELEETDSSVAAPVEKTNSKPEGSSEPGSEKETEPLTEESSASVVTTDSNDLEQCTEVSASESVQDLVNTESSDIVISDTTSQEVNQISLEPTGKPKRKPLQRPVVTRKVIKPKRPASAESSSGVTQAVKPKYRIRQAGSKEHPGCRSSGIFRTDCSDAFVRTSLQNR